MRSRTCSAVAAALVLAAASSASAQSGSCDSARHREGQALRAAGRTREALAVFRSLYEQEHSACAQARMGLTLEVLEQWTDADAALRGALASGTDPWIAQNRAALQQQLAAVQAHLGRLAVRVEPAVPAAELWVNDTRVGPLPLREPLRLGAGPVNLEVRASGYTTARRTVLVAAQRDASETFSLERAAGGVATPAEGPAGAVTAAVAGPTGPERGAARSRISPVGPIVLGAGVVIAASAIIPWLMADGIHSELVARGCTLAAPCSDRTSVDQANQGRALDTVTNVLLVSGLVVTAAGAVLTPLLRTPVESAARVSLQASPAGGGLTLEGRF